MNVPVKVQVDGKTHDGMLTTEHAMSSYNLPVVVVEGQALGSGEVELVEVPLPKTAEEANEIRERLEAAGFSYSWT